MTFEPPPTVLDVLLSEFVGNTDTDEQSINRRTNALRSALTVPNDTDDNRTAASHLSARKVNRPYGRGIVPVAEPSGIPIASIFWALEDADEIPKTLQSSLPELSLDEWQAALRLTIHVISSAKVCLPECDQTTS